MHRIPIRVLPDDKSASTTAAAAAAGTKPYAATTAAPLSVPYVPPLANTFASTNVNTIPMVPNTGKTDAEIVFGGVTGFVGTTAPAAQWQPTPNANEQQQQQQQLPPTLPPTTQHQHPSNESTVATTHTQSIELANVSTEQSISSNAPPPAVSNVPTYASSQQPSIFGTVPPTSIPSLNESFNIPSTINPSSVPPPPPSSTYQTNPMQCK